MSLNLTSLWLEARQAVSLLCFSKTLATSSTWINGPGGVAGDGYPMPCPGIIRGLQVFDGISVVSDTGDTEFEAGDRISLYATYLGDGLFSVAVTLNAAPLSIVATPVSASADLFATIHLLLLEDA